MRWRGGCVAGTVIREGALEVLIDQVGVEGDRRG
jgi:hypothetical protein